MASNFQAATVIVVIVVISMSLASEANEANRRVKRDEKKNKVVVKGSVTGSKHNIDVDYTRHLSKDVDLYANYNHNDKSGSSFHSGLRIKFKRSLGDN